jgi:quercetin dioxygenase-like cupin family protein
VAPELLSPPRHHVTRLEPSQLEIPRGYAEHSEGYQRVSHVDGSVGAVHTGLGTSMLAPDGRVDSHVHSFEEFVFVTQGDPVLTLDGRSVRLQSDDCAFIGVGATHAWQNPGSDACSWIEFQAPQARPEGASPDTFFVEAEPSNNAAPVDVRDPRTRSFFRWHRGQMDLDLLKETLSEDAIEVSAGMSSALLAYSGISVKMLLDERHGARLGNMFMVDYREGVVLQPHDHPLEEAFYMLEGEVVYTADGDEYTLGVGDVAFAGVGCIHSFENRSGRRTRWVETRSPQPPAHHEYRFNRDWDYLAQSTSG